MPAKLTSFNELVQNGDVISGRWELGGDHRLRYRRSGKNETIALEGTLVAAEPAALVFAVTEKQTDQKIVASLLDLKGTWSMDAKNRIQFRVIRGVKKNDTLTFEGHWRLDPNHQVIYSFRETDLKTKKRQTRLLSFKGHWDISKKNEIDYFFAAGSDSVFRLHGSFIDKNILAGKGQLRYELGAGMAANRGKKTIVLFGRWKMLKDLELAFEIEQGEGKKRMIIFDGDYRLDKQKRIHVRLKNQRGVALGLEVILTKEFLKSQGEAFIGFNKSPEELRLEGGLRFRW